MKTWIHSTLLIPIMLFSMFVFGAGDQISRDIPVKHFDRIEVGGAVRLIIVQAETPALRVTTTDKMTDRIKIRQSGDELHLGIKTEKWSWFNWGYGRNRDDVLFEVRMPELKILHAGGATMVKLHDMQSGDLDLQFDGASKLTADKMSFGEISANISGASRVNISALNAEKMRMDLSGASETTFGGLQIDTLKLGLSGASRVNVSATGQAKYVTVGLSGASKYHGEKLIADHVEINASGASEAVVHAEKSLKAGTSGASHIEYSGKPESVDVGSSNSITSIHL